MQDKVELSIVEIRAIRIINECIDEIQAGNVFVALQRLTLNRDLEHEPLYYCGVRGFKERVIENMCADNKRGTHNTEKFLRHIINDAINFSVYHFPKGKYTRKTVNIDCSELFRHVRDL